MSRYAQGTQVSTERSRAEIERTLFRYGCDDVVTGQSGRLAQAFVQFRYRSLPVEIRIPLPKPDEDRFRLSPTGRRRRDEQHSSAAWEKECRQQWRVLLLMLKANLEAVANGVMKPERAFLSWLVLPQGQTVGDVLDGRLAQFLSSGEIPKSLPFPEVKEHTR